MFAFAGRASAGLAAGSGDTPYLFFSRRIGLDRLRETPQRAGGRLTGKVGATTVGLLNVQTGENDAVGVEGANFTVLRAKRDILRRSGAQERAIELLTLVGNDTATMIQEGDSNKVGRRAQRAAEIDSIAQARNSDAAGVV